MTKLLFTSLLALSVSACSVLPQATPEEAVAKRSAKRLEAMQNNDYASAYKYMSPGYRATTSVRFFEADHIGFSVMKGYEILSVDCEENRCRVGLNARFNMADIGAMAGMRGSNSPSGETDMFFQETWVYMDGKWWATKGRK